MWDEERARSLPVWVIAVLPRKYLRLKQAYVGRPDIDSKERERERERERQTESDVQKVYLPDPTPHTIRSKEKSLAIDRTDADAPYDSHVCRFTSAHRNLHTARPFRQQGLHRARVCVRVCVRVSVYVYVYVSMSVSVSVSVYVCVCVCLCV